MQGDNKYEAQDWYDLCNTIQVKMKLNKKTDADILAWIEEKKYGRGSSIQGAIKALIRADIAREKIQNDSGDN